MKDDTRKGDVTQIVQENQNGQTTLKLFPDQIGSEAAMRIQAAFDSALPAGKSATLRISVLDSARNKAGITFRVKGTDSFLLLVRSGREESDALEMARQVRESGAAPIEVSTDTGGCSSDLYVLGHPDTAFQIVAAVGGETGRAGEKGAEPK